MAKSPGSAAFPEIVRQAPFILDGTITKLNAATLPSIVPTEATAIVEVNEVFRAPATIGNLKGKKITLQLASAKGAKVGQQATFYATSWMYGDSVALTELSREAAKSGEAAVSDMRNRVANAELQLEDLALQERIERAQFIVTGWVSEIGPERDTAARMPVSEHAPDWWWAQIQAEHVEKGKLRDATIRMLYPNSTDELWLDAPKCHVGQRGVWLLQQNQKEKGPPAMRVPGLTALHPLDFQQPNYLNRIRALAKRSTR